jgi:hypothetical protein
VPCGSPSGSGTWHHGPDTTGPAKDVFRRTLTFLLRFVSEAELRQSIRAETTKIESHNDFLDWIGFGGPVIKSGDPVEQLKQVK